MKLRLSFFSICAMLLFAGALFTSCTQTTTPGSTTTAHTDTWRDMNGLTVGQTYQFSVTGSSPSTMITGVSSWKDGTVRVFWSRGLGDSSDVVVNTSGSTSPSISWAAVTSNTLTLRLYETAAPSNVGPSGLVLGPNPRVVTLTGADKDNIDLVLQSDQNIPSGAPYIALVSADLNATNNRSAKFGFPIPASGTYVKGGLAAQMFSTGDLTGLMTTINAFDILASHADSSSAVFIVRTSDSHYSRVEIVPQPTAKVNNVSGNYLWGETIDPKHYRFIDVNVTYNITAGSAYAAIFNAKDASLAFAD